MEEIKLAPTRKQVKNTQYYQHIDGELLSQEIYKNKNYRTHTQFAFALGCSQSMISEGIRRGYIRKIYMRAICDLLDKPIGYFDVKEEPEPVEQRQKTPEIIEGGGRRKSPIFSRQSSLWSLRRLRVC